MRGYGCHCVGDEQHCDSDDERIGGTGGGDDVRPKATDCVDADNGGGGSALKTIVHWLQDVEGELWEVEEKQDERCTGDMGVKSGDLCESAITQFSCCCCSSHLFNSTFASPLLLVIPSITLSRLW